MLSVGLCLFCVAACQKMPLVDDGQRRLVGNYTLNVGDDCRNEQIEQAQLMLRADKTYTQMARFADGTQYSLTGEHWTYDGEGHIDFPKLHVGTHGIKGRANLLLEFGRPNVILLNPHGDCFYSQDPQ